MAFACGATRACGPLKPYVWLRMMITAQTVAADTRDPRNFHDSCFFGEDPSQYPIFRSVMKDPETERAVHTTPPMRRALSMPEGPVRPVRTSTKDERMSVINVIPETGFVPTIAIAFAATVVNKNDTTRTSAIPTRAWVMLNTTRSEERRVGKEC